MVPALPQVLPLPSRHQSGAQPSSTSGRSLLSRVVRLLEDQDRQVFFSWSRFFSLSPHFSVPRYYFKKVSDEFDCGVVFEEVREDEAVLPVFEEKIIGKVEKVD